MTAQTWIMKRAHLAYLALFYAIWGDEVRSEALRVMMRQMSLNRFAIEAPWKGADISPSAPSIARGHAHMNLKR